MSVAAAAENNARLLFRLKAELGAGDFGKICNFFEVEAKWCCPCCVRAKPDLARLDKWGNLLCRLVFHHDHFETCVDEAMREQTRGVEWHARCALENSFVRFPHTLVCEDCNNAETTAKRIAGCPAYFSFAPHEIALFITARPNVSHEVSEPRVMEVWAAAEPAMRVIGKRLRVLTGRVREVDANWEQLGLLTNRIVNNSRKAMKENNAD